jgi:two-component system chemotaxis response regulator CheY
MTKMILTAEDSPSVRQAISLTLMGAGYTVLEAADGQDALRKASETKIDMLLTDINMPVMDGIELIKHIRAVHDYRFIPIITLTTESQIDKKDEGRKAGATGWIVKPFKPEKLLEVIRKVLK